LVGRIRSQYTIQEISGTRIYRHCGEVTEHKPIINALMLLPAVERNKLCTAMSGFTSNVPPGPVSTFIEVGNVDELKAAQEVGQAGKVETITKYELASKLCKLGPGNSGARINYQSEPGRRIWKYLLPNGESLAEMWHGVADFAYGSIEGADEFFKALVADGHDVMKCFGNPYEDFFIMIFAATYAMRWDGNAKKMIINTRPGIEEMSLAVKTSKERSVTVRLLDETRGAFKEIMDKYRRHFSSLPVLSSPADQLAWLWEHRPTNSTILGLAETYSELINTFASAWDQHFRNAVMALECDFIETFALSQAPDSFVGKLTPCSLTNAIDMLIKSRSYRGKTDGNTAAAVLNTSMKYVGLEPAGPNFTAVGDLARYVPVIEEAMSQGFSEIDIYIHGREFGLIEHFKNLGVTVNVFTNAQNSAFTTRDFYTDGPSRVATNVFVVVDYLPKSESEKGVEPLVLDWNAHGAVLDKIGVQKIKNVAVFHRLSLNKMGSTKNPTYGVADLKMADQIKHWPMVGVGFRGVRHHNGEFVLFAFDGVERPPIKNQEGNVNYVGLATEGQRLVFISQLARVIASRIAVANQARTYAIPCGRWMYDTLVVELPNGKKHDPSANFERLMGIRLSDAVKSSRAEITTVSHANEFGEGVRIGDAPPIEFLNLLKGPKKIDEFLAIREKKEPVAPPPTPPKEGVEEGKPPANPKLGEEKAHVAKK
jgi:hypothetical protein